MEKNSYKTSKDMKRLKELLDMGFEVICFYTYDWNTPQLGEKPEEHEPMMTTDICTAKLVEKGGKYEQYVLSCRGTQFLHYFTKDMPYKYTFMELLEARDIQFIDPVVESPESLDEAAGDYASYYFDCDNKQEMKAVVDTFKAGAEWMAEQGETIEGIITAIGNNRWVDLDDKQLDTQLASFNDGDKVIVQIRKK